MLASNSALTKHRYFRLMALATTELICTTPFAAYSIFLNVTTNAMTPYRGWDDLHFDYWKVDQIPALLWRLNPKNVVAFEMTRWMVVVCAFVFFMFFGFADEARRNYKNAFQNIMKRLGMKSESVCFRYVIPNHFFRRTCLIVSSVAITTSAPPKRRVLPSTAAEFFLSLSLARDLHIPVIHS